jgi:hypothetical protein
MKQRYESHSTMPFPLEIADLASGPGLAALRLGYVITVFALAFIIRRAPKPIHRKGGK